MTHTDKRLVVTATTGDGVVIDVAELLIPSSVNLNNLVIETKIVNDTPPRLKRDRSPLSTDALRLADLRVGMHIRVVHAGHCSDLLSHEAIVTGHPRRSDNDNDNIIVPVAIIIPEGGVHHTTLDAAGMGLVRGKDGWSNLRYTLGIA